MAKKKEIIQTPRVAIYIRVSTIWQVDKESLGVQRRELIAYAQMVLGIQDVVVFEDAGYSAKNTDRPDYQKMIARIRSGEFSHLLVWKIDRISRNLLDFAEMYQELKSLGVTFVSKTEQFDTSSAIGEAMLKIILVFAELERNMSSERVSGVLLSLAESGHWNGGRVPFGYSYKKEEKLLYINPEEADVVKRIFQTYESNQSIQYVSNSLNNAGIRTRAGREWGATTVHIILTNPFYIGTYKYNVHKGGRGIKKRPESEWVYIENHHPPIIDKTLYDRVQFLLKRNKRGGNDRYDTFQRKNVHVFAGLIRCGSCGKNFSATVDRRRADGWKPSIYGCSKRRNNNSECQNKFISDVTLGPFVFTFISNLLKAKQAMHPNSTASTLEKKLLRSDIFLAVDSINNDALEQTLELFKENKTGVEYKPANVFTKSESTTNDYELLVARQKKLGTALNRLKAVYLYGDEGGSEAEYISERNKIVEELKSIESKLSAIQQSEIDISMYGQEFETKASYFLMIQELMADNYFNYQSFITAADPNVPKSFLNTVVDNIVATDGRVSCITFKNGISYHFTYK